MKFTCILKDPGEGNVHVTLRNTTDLSAFLEQLFKDLSNLPNSTNFTITIEKEAPECLIQTLS
jgi:hypothetical protein